ncbi:nucleoside diphosphate kinase 6 isoform X2 [Coccinella septempunctata]|uniref:nucleoside diphosphate kinase 6 isoform X2 n=1 Tax=Coccinella septempunctata TaxID=41139 RepID=UPI001D09301E|nr:nucleoside diphosphate kinase 6 isoform X2 [Coccinella septempunctata]
MMKNLELTLAIIKPHLVKNPVALNAVRKKILDANFKVVKSKRRKLTLDNAEIFYQEHANKFFYNRLVTSMTSGPSETYVLARENAIQHWRQLMGPTKVYKAQFDQPYSIRGQFGLSDTRNAAHGAACHYRFPKIGGKRNWHTLS